jgi:hypothetical protein
MASLSWGATCFPFLLGLLSSWPVFTVNPTGENPGAWKRESGHLAFSDWLCNSTLNCDCVHSPQGGYSGSLGGISLFPTNPVWREWWNAVTMSLCYTTEKTGNVVMTISETTVWSLSFRCSPPLNTNVRQESKQLTYLDSFVFDCTGFEFRAVFLLGENISHTPAPFLL